MKLREKIKATDDVAKRIIEVPEWNATLEVRSMTGAQRTRVFSRNTDKQGKIQTDRIYLDVIVCCVYDPETGERVFTEEDTEWLGDKKGAVLERIGTIAFEVSGLGKEAVEQAEKNSDSGIQKEDSTML